MGFLKKLTKRTINAATDAAKEVIQERTEERKKAFADDIENRKRLVEAAKFGAHIGAGIGAMMPASAVKIVVTVTRVL